MTENEAIKSNKELGCEIACKVIAQVNEKTIEFEAKMMDVALKRWGYCKADVEKALLELEQYRKLGTVEECRKAVEKTKAKKCIQDTCSDHTHYKCPNCGKIQMSEYKRGIRILGRITNNCDNCGQRLESEE